MTQKEAAGVASVIATQFDAYVGRFDAKKYPERVYRRLLREFAKVPLASPLKSIPDALRWKYGHWSKDNFPGHQRRLMHRIAKSWSAAIRPRDPELAFDKLKATLSLPYISAAFLTHLMYPAAVPIIDQHNYRAMNALMGRKSSAAPSSYEDLVDLRRFIDEVLSAWPHGSGKGPHERDLDKFLMAYGKSLKVKRARRRKAEGGGLAKAQEMGATRGTEKTRASRSNSKMDVARGVYGRMADQPSRVVRRALMTEAGLTEKGASTYCYKLRQEYSMRRQ